MVQEFPTVVDGGQDAAPHQIQVEEEEFDLSDIMAEQLEAQVGTKEDRLRQLEEQVCLQESQQPYQHDVCCKTVAMQCLAVDANPLAVAS